ncbi:hypothetical protein LIER_40136 [Lithospermum erythrorhizon]|uniref:Uncharacterized protein n=1 Tax=Lithospermum erythrorhizon TaxID=34254 RepID=A0AAV3QRL9_LITER
MLCSISTKKSNSKWLDRLRSSKGFTSQNQTDPQPHFSSSQPTSIKSTVESTEVHGSQRETPFLGDFIAKMFAFGPDTCDFPIKKAPRKMPNPRSYKNGDLDLRVLQRSDDCSRNVVEKKGVFVGGGKVVLEKKRFFEEGGEVVVGKKGFFDEEDEKMDWNLSGFSRTEVSVIDTSYKGWKFEKVLFRKKSVWRVRDRNSKVLNFENNSKTKMKMKTKKRKLSKDEVEVGVCKKKKKKTIDLGECSLAREGTRGEFAMQINDQTYINPMMLLSG